MSVSAFLFLSFLFQQKNYCLNDILENTERISIIYFEKRRIFSVRISEGEEEITAYLSGDIDHHSARDMRESIDAIVQMKKPSLLRLDFSGVKFMDSSGIGLIMGRYRLMALYGGIVRVVNVPDELERMMNLSGLSSLDIIERRGVKLETAK